MVRHNPATERSSKMTTKNHTEGWKLVVAHLRIIASPQPNPVLLFVVTTYVPFAGTSQNQTAEPCAVTANNTAETLLAHTY